MKLQELSQEDWHLLDRKFREMVPGYKYSDIHKALGVVRAIINHTTGENSRPILMGLLSNAMEFSFEDIPLKMGCANRIQQVVFAFRLERGI